MKKLPIEITLPNGFLEAEERCGYLVTAKQKRIWSIELDLLKKLLDVCRAHDIKVQIFAGTLLGAIRHKGFIPWDDDVDVALDRENFEKLIAIGPNEFKEPYFFQTALTDRKTFLSEARLRNSLTTAYVKGQSTLESHNGIYIDILVLDGVVRNKFLVSVQNLFKIVIRKILTSYNMQMVEGCIIKRLVAGIVVSLSHVLTFETWYRIYHHVLAMYTAYSNMIGLVTHSNDFMQKYALTKNEFATSTMMRFEGLEVPVPVASDAILKRIYGEYWQYPPVSKRGLWHAGQICFDPDVPFGIYKKINSSRDGECDEEK
ncbi:MAG: LicD family protein [Kiritimatiellae bacterium]|nr:LicD family protein [Kiritimatiellia bacterium]MBQ8126680.1 LicD family protein [Kiritimatiellia bacterium]